MSKNMLWVGDECEGFFYLKNKIRTLFVKGCFSSEMLRCIAEEYACQRIYFGAGRSAVCIPKDALEKLKKFILVAEYRFFEYDDGTIFEGLDEYIVTFPETVTRIKVECLEKNSIRIIETSSLDKHIIENVDFSKDLVEGDKLVYINERD